MNMNTKENLTKITLMVSEDLLQALDAERTRVMNESGLRVSVSQIANAIMRRGIGPQITSLVGQ